MDLTEILADRKTFTDDMEIILGTQKVTLGQIRDSSAKQQKDLSDRIAAAEAREALANTNATKAAELITALEDTHKKLVANAGRPPAGAAPQTASDGWDDEWWNPVRKQLAERDKKIEQMVAGIEALNKSIERSATIWAHDRWHAQFDRVAPRLRKVEKYKDWDYNKTLEYAANQKLNDEYGFPSIEKAVAELTKQNDIEAARKEGFEEGRKAGNTQNRVANMVRPSSATGGKVPTKGHTAVEEFGLEGLGDDVAQDAELMDQLSQLGEITNLQ